LATSYLKIDLERDLLERAYHQAQALPVFDNSHRGLDANYIGCIGEILVADYLERHGVKVDDDRETTTHDFRVGPSKFTVDVKTKDRTVAPKIFYDNSVPLYNHEHQRPDFYYFVSLYRPTNASKDDMFRFQQAFVIGGISIETLDSVGKKWEAGQVDPSNGTKFWTACANVSMAQLLSNKEMIDVLSK
jgi:hypothetical protein